VEVKFVQIQFRKRFPQSGPLELQFCSEMRALVHPSFSFAASTVLLMLSRPPRKSCAAHASLFTSRDIVTVTGALNSTQLLLYASSLRHCSM